MESFMVPLSNKAVLIDKEIIFDVDMELWFRLWGDNDRISVTRCKLATEICRLPSNWIHSA